jgi:hypothetical protein
MKFWVMIVLFIASAWLGFYVTPFLYGLGVIAIPFVFADNIAKMATKQTITTHNTTKAKPMLNKETKNFLKFIVLGITIAGVIIAFDEHKPEIGGVSLAFFLVSMFLLADKEEIKPLDDEFDYEKDIFDPTRFFMPNNIYYDEKF